MINKRSNRSIFAVDENRLLFLCGILSVLVAAGVFFYAAFMAIETGADVIRADAWRYLTIFGDFVVNKDGSVLDATLSDHHFDILNVIIYLADYKYFHLSGYMPSFLGFFSGIVLALLLSSGIIYPHRHSLQKKMVGILVVFLIIPTTFITLTAPQYINWNLVTLSGFRLLLVYGVLSLSFLSTFRKTNCFVFAVVCAFIVCMLTNTIATLVCLSIVAASLVVFGLTGRINGYRIAGFLVGTFLALYSIRQLGFNGASAVVNFSDVELFPVVFSVAKGAALAFFSPIIAKEIIDGHTNELIFLHFLFVCYAVYSIYRSQHSNLGIVVIIVSLYMLYLAAYLSGVLFRFGFSDPVGVAFVPRYYSLYICGSAAMALLVFYRYLTSVARFDEAILFGFFFLFTVVKLATFYEFSSTYGYAKSYYDKVRVAIFCHRSDGAFPTSSPSLSDQQKRKAINYLEENNLSVFYLNHAGFFEKPLSCEKNSE